jgi:hypothetical protein
MTDSRPACPFCAAPWSDAMLAQFAAMSSPCSCCGGPAAEEAQAPLPTPSEDLCCGACGRAIYLNPHAAA